MRRRLLGPLVLVLALVVLVALGLRDRLERMPLFGGEVIANRGIAADVDSGAAAKAVDPTSAADAQGPNMASYAVAEAKDAQEQADLAAKTSEAGGIQAPARLSLEAARTAMDDYEREVDCEYVRLAQAPAKVAERERQWRWLPVEIAQMERMAFDDAVSRVGRGCPRWSDDAAAYQQRRKQRRANAALAAQVGELRALLTNSGLEGQLAPTLAQAMYDALLSGDPKLIERIGYADMVWSGYGNRTMAERMGVRRELWTLVACDLGLDCLPGGPTLDRYCLRFGICGYPNLEATIRQWASGRTMEVLQNQRAELLQRIRSGQIAGLFDPPKNPLPGGP